MAAGGVLFDIDGVLVTSWQPVPGAARALRALAGRGLPCCYLTNTTSRTRRQIAAALAAAGMAVRAEEVITAAALTADYLHANHPGARCYLVNDGEIAEDMPGVHVVDADPDVVVLGGAGPQFSHDTLSRVYDWMVQGVPIVAMHRSTFWKTAEGLRIDTGMYLIGMEQSSGRPATAVGKPAPTGFLVAAARVGVDPGQVWMVGDDLHNDVLAAQAVGMTGVLVRTGKFRPETLDRCVADGGPRPDHVIDSVADLPALLGGVTGRR